MRWLGIDFGKKRIGLAVGVDEPQVTTAKPYLTPSGSLRTDAAAIADLARKLEVDGIVVGIPENEADARMARICHRLADEIRQLGQDVRTVDESLTSVEAERNMASSETTVAQRRKWKDGEAARLILERFFEQERS